jgi:hypothetical protein
VTSWRKIPLALKMPATQIQMRGSPLRMPDLSGSASLRNRLSVLIVAVHSKPDSSNTSDAVYCCELYEPPVPPLSAPNRLSESHWSSCGAPE